MTESGRVGYTLQKYQPHSDIMYSCDCWFWLVSWYLSSFSISHYLPNKQDSCKMHSKIAQAAIIGPRLHQNSGKITYSPQWGKFSRAYMALWWPIRPATSLTRWLWCWYKWSAWKLKSYIWETHTCHQTEQLYCCLSQSPMQAIHRSNSKLIFFWKSDILWSDEANIVFEIQNWKDLEIQTMYGLRPLSHIRTVCFSSIHMKNKCKQMIICIHQHLFFYNGLKPYFFSVNKTE